MANTPGDDTTADEPAGDEPTEEVEAATDTDAAAGESHDEADADEDVEGHVFGAVTGLRTNLIADTIYGGAGNDSLLSPAPGVIRPFRDEITRRSPRGY